MKIHYYMLCYGFEALVASHLEPEAFGLYMSIGTQKNTRGNVLFFEIDPDLSSNYFHLFDINERCVPHKDGSPKRSKYISIYRVLEHLNLSCFGKLYLTTADGRVMCLDSSIYTEPDNTDGPNLYQELCPVSPMVVSRLHPEGFVKFMTDPNNPVNIPRLFFADMLIEIDKTGHLAGNLPYADPAHIVDCVKELGTTGSKLTKTVSRNPQIHGFFRTIRRGFFLGDQTGMKYYAFPGRQILEVEHAKWWRSASESMVS